MDPEPQPVTLPETSRSSMNKYKIKSTDREGGIEDYSPEPKQNTKSHMSIATGGGRVSQRESGSVEEVIE